MKIYNGINGVNGFHEFLSTLRKAPTRHYVLHVPEIMAHQLATSNGVNFLLLLPQ